MGKWATRDSPPTRAIPDPQKCGHCPVMIDKFNDPVWPDQCPNCKMFICAKTPGNEGCLFKPCLKGNE